MSKNVFAAILKFINGKNDGAESLRAVCDYTTDKAKTDDGTLIATQGCSPEHPVEDMLANKRLHNKTHGKQYEHFVLAPCSNGSDKSAEDILKVTKEIVATLYPENMAIIAVHTDTKVAHSHTILDSVNAVTGRKFSQGPSDLNRVKQKANSILKKHGFEIITASANEFVDNTDYSNEEGFQFLELQELQIITESEIVELEYSPDILFEELERISIQEIKRPYFQPTTDIGEIQMEVTKLFLSPTKPTSSFPAPLIKEQELPTSISTVENVPTIDSRYPTTSVATGPLFRIKGTSDSNFAGLNELVAQTTAYAKEHQRESANLALAMQKHCQQEGYPSNVSVCAGPIFDIDMTGGMYSPLPDEGNNNFY